jgi:pSer/pThr/pTyr-binding forkhead associated (FHA) protein
MYPFWTLINIHLAQIFIKDVKSSNGTFVNGKRLSAEGLESEPHELKSDDVVVRCKYIGFFEMTLS